MFLKAIRVTDFTKSIHSSIRITLSKYTLNKASLPIHFLCRSHPLSILLVYALSLARFSEWYSCVAKRGILLPLSLCNVPFSIVSPWVMSFAQWGNLLLLLIVQCPFSYSLSLFLRSHCCNRNQRIAIFHHHGGDTTSGWETRCLCTVTVCTSFRWANP